MAVDVSDAASARPSIRPSRTASARSASGRSSPSTTGRRSPSKRLASAIEAGPALALALRRPPAGRAARGRDRRSRAGRRSSRAAARERARDRRALSQARSLEPDPLVQGPRRRGRGREGERVRLRHALGHLDRQPRERGRARAPPAIGMPAVIFCPAGLEPEKLQATTVYGARIYGVRGSYDDCSRLVSELAGEVEWGIVNVNLRSYYAEGSKTLAFEISEQLGWETPDAVVMPIGSGAMFTKVWQGLRAVPRGSSSSTGRSRSSSAARPRAARPSPTAFATSERVTPVRPNTVVSSIAIGNPADGDLAVELAPATSGGAIYSVPEDEVGANIALLAETAGIFGEGATGRCDRRAARGGRARRARREGPRRRARHRHRLEDAAARRAHRRGGRDRGRRRRAARGSRGRLYEALEDVVARADHGARPASCSTTINRRLES